MSFLLSEVCFAQEKGEDQYANLSHNSTLLGWGTYSLRDTYLSPLEYTGWGIRLLDDRMRMTNLMQGKVSTQQLVNVDFSSTESRVASASDYSFLLDYSYGGHYHFKPTSKLSLLMGSQLNFNLGAIYNTRNGNNPVSAKAGVNLNFSGIANYSFNIWKRPFTLRYQMDMPLVGVLFSPRFGQSYYEISLGNYEGLAHFVSFGQPLNMKNYLTLEVPLASSTIRFTYLNSVYQTDVNLLKTKISSNTFMIGLAKDIFSVPLGQNKKQSNYRRVFD